MTVSSRPTRRSPPLAERRSLSLVSYLNVTTGLGLFADLSWPSFKVGLALREQVLAAGEEVPVGANDVRVDMVVTPDEMITLHQI